MKVKSQGMVDRTYPAILAWLLPGTGSAAQLAQLGSCAAQDTGKAWQLARHGPVCCSRGARCQPGVQLGQLGPVQCSGADSKMKILRLMCMHCCIEGSLDSAGTPAAAWTSMGLSGFMPHVLCHHVLTRMPHIRQS